MDDDTNPPPGLLQLKSNFAAFNEPEPPSPNSDKEPFRVSSFRVSRADNGKAVSTPQQPVGEAKEAEVKSSFSSVLDGLVDDDDDNLEPDSASRPPRNDSRVSYDYDPLESKHQSRQSTPSTQQPPDLDAPPPMPYDPYTGVEGYMYTYAPQYAYPGYNYYMQQPMMYAPGYGVPMYDMYGQPVSMPYVIPPPYPVDPATLRVHYPGDEEYYNDEPEMPFQRPTLSAEQRKKIAERAAKATENAIKRAGGGTPAKGPSFGSSGTGRTGSDARAFTRPEGGKQKPRTGRQGSVISRPASVTDDGFNPPPIAGSPPAPPSVASSEGKRKGKKAGNTSQSVASTSCEHEDAATTTSVLTELPGEVDRLIAASELLRRTDRLISVVDVHDAMLALCRATALRDSYSTMRDVLSDVPLAVMCIPKPNDDALLSVVAGMDTIRKVFDAQIAAAREAISEDPGAGFYQYKLSGGPAAQLPRPAEVVSDATGSVETGSVVTEETAGSAQRSRDTPSDDIGIAVTPESYLFPTGVAPVAYYGDSDFGEVNGTKFLRDASLDDASLDEINVTELLETFPMEVKNAFDCLRAVWQDKFRKEEELSREVLAENRVMIRQVWENGIDTSCKVLPLAADTRSTYSGQMKRLEQLAALDRDTDWNVPSSRSDLRWHAMIRLYNAFCRHVALPRFKLSASLPRPMALYLRSLVRGSTEEEREGVDFLDDWLNEGSEPAEMFAPGGVDWEAVADAASKGQHITELGLTEDGEMNTHCRKLGQLLRDPGAWWAGFQHQWNTNQLTLARRWWKRCERGEPSNEQELLDRFRDVGIRWRKGKSTPSWRDLKSGSGSQWGGASWGQCVSWVHYHLFESAKAASVQWREFSARRLVFRGLNEQMRQDVFNTMMYVAGSLQQTEVEIADAHRLHAEQRELVFRDEINRLGDQEAQLCRQLEAEGEHNPLVLKCLHALGRRIRPAQMTVHRRMLAQHITELSPLLEDIKIAAIAAAAECAADRVYEAVAGSDAAKWYGENAEV